MLFKEMSKLWNIIIQNLQTGIKCLQYHNINLGSSLTVTYILIFLPQLDINNKLNAFNKSYLIIGFSFEKNLNCQ